MSERREFTETDIKQILDEAAAISSKLRETVATASIDGVTRGVNQDVMANAMMLGIVQMLAEVSVNLGIPEEGVLQNLKNCYQQAAATAVPSPA